MTLSQRLAGEVRAAFTGIWIESHEHHDALAEIARLCQDQRWSLAVWDVEQGLRVSGPPAGPENTAPVNTAADPLAAVRSHAALARQSPQRPDGSALLVLVNFHRF